MVCRYGVMKILSNKSSDYAAMEEVHRLLKAGGQLLMTVPCGQRARTPLHRIYDGESLQTLLEIFEIQNAEYGMKMDDRTWISPVTEKEASRQAHNPNSNAPSALAVMLCTEP